MSPPSGATGATGEDEERIPTAHILVYSLPLVGVFFANGLIF